MITVKCRYHISCLSGEMGRCCIFPGDPGRCEKIAQYFDNAVHVTNTSREYMSIEYPAVQDYLMLSALTDAAAVSSAFSSAGVRAELNIAHLALQKSWDPPYAGATSVGTKKRRVDLTGHRNAGIIAKIVQFARKCEQER
jgi:uridine phosphorylase